MKAEILKFLTNNYPHARGVMLDEEGSIDHEINLAEILEAYAKQSSPSEILTAEEFEAETPVIDNMPVEYLTKWEFAEAYAKQLSLSGKENHYADLVSRIINHAKTAPYEPYQEKLLRFIVDELEIIKRKLLPEPPKQ